MDDSLRLKPLVDIGDRRIGPGEPTYVIAEAGSNHDGDLGAARRLIEVAAGAGCDAVKFQVFRADQLMLPGGPSAAHLAEDVDVGGLYSLFERMAIDRDWLPQLAGECARAGVDFLATPFDVEAVALLADLGAPAMKNASSELWHLPLIEAEAKTGLPMIVSTGMADLDDVRTALTSALRAGASEICLMQCTVSYPTPADQVNLAAMDSLRAEFGCPVGLSDHTTGIWAPVAAVARGADVIEKHITLDRRRSGPDHRFAIEPDELAGMVDAIRNVEAAIGSGVKERLPVEDEIYRIGRRNLVTSRALEPGVVIASEDLEVLRSPLGIAPAEVDRVVGRRVARPIAALTVLQWEDLV